MNFDLEIPRDVSSSLMAQDSNVLCIFYCQIQSKSIITKNQEVISRKRLSLGV